MKTFQELKGLTKHIPEGLPTIKVALLGDSATQLLGTAIRGMGVERGFCIDLWEADYNQVSDTRLYLRLSSIWRRLYHNIPVHAQAIREVQPCNADGAQGVVR